MNAVRRRAIALLALGLLAACSSSTSHPGSASQPAQRPTSASGPAAPARPEAVLDGNGELAVGAGSVWLLADAGKKSVVHRVDPASLKVVATIPAGAGAVTVTFGAGAVWVPNGDDGTLTRVDPATNTARTIKVGGEPFEVGTDAHSTWLVDASGKVERLNPATGVPIGRPFNFARYATYDFQALDCDIVVESNALYVFTTGGASFRISLRNGAPAAVSKFRAAAVMAPDGKSLWVTDVDPDSLTKVDLATGRVLLQRRAFGQTMVATANALWYSNGYRVTELNKQTGATIATQTVGSSESNLGLAAGDGQVWAFNIVDTTLVRVFP